MRSHTFRSAVGLVVVGLALAACSGEESSYTTDSDAIGRAVCVVDEDGDAHGLGCPQGLDCNDLDPHVFEGCELCAEPDEGCACKNGSAPVDCFTQELVDERTLLCHVGTRYCQAGTWSACLGITSFEADAPKRRSLAASTNQALVPNPPDATPCSPCRPTCFEVTDALAPVSGGLAGTSSNVEWLPSGGITNGSTTTGSPVDIGPPSGCQLGTPPDADCDGIPDTVDAVSGPNQSGTVGQTVYMDLAPGESNDADVDLPIYVRTADVYFLVDTTASMTTLLPHIEAAMSTGNYLDNMGPITCPDSDADGMPNDELASLGIAGNVQCAFRDGALGAGFVREIPFLGPDANGIEYGDADEIPYEHRVDLGASAASLTAALSGFVTNADHGGPHGQMQGLWAAVSGEESYVGWDRSGIPQRRGCPAGTTGYACFRSTALPIVVLFTSDAMYDGPTSNLSSLGSNGSAEYPLAHPSSIHAQQVSTGSYPHYLPVANSNESFASAYDMRFEARPGANVGAITDDWLTFTGDTRAMSADVNAAVMGCDGLASSAGADAVYRFSVDVTQRLTLSTQGSHFPTTLGIVRASATGTKPSALDIETAPGAGDTSPIPLGELQRGVSAVIRGDTTSATGQFPREFLGCYDQATFSGQASTDSTDYAADVLFDFTLSSDMALVFEALEGGYGKSLSLYEGTPSVSASMDQVVTDGEHIAVAGDLSGSAVRVIAGYQGAGATRTPVSLSTRGRSADIADSLFASVGCSPASTYAPDEVVDFSLSRPTTIRIETSGDAPAMAPDFDHLIGLYKRAPDPAPHDLEAGGNELFASALNIPEADLENGGYARVTGSVATALGANDASTTKMSADYSRAFTGGTTGCGSLQRGGGADASPDAVFELTLSERRTLQLDTRGSSYRTYLSLHQGELSNAGNTNDTQATARDLGVVNGMSTTIRGSTAAATIRQNYSPLNTDPRFGRPPKSLGCGTYSPDAVFRFTLDAPTTVQVDTFGSAWDTVLGLYASGGPAEYVLSGSTYSYPSSLGCNDDALRPDGQAFYESSIRQTLPAGTYYVVVAGYGLATGSYVLNVSDVGSPMPVLHGSPSNLVACDSGSLPGDSERSKIVRTLEPGTYYVVLKGDATQTFPSYDYVLNVFDLENAPPPDSLIACGQHNLEPSSPAVPSGGRAYIEQSLPAGNYSVVVRGSRTSDVGSYRLTISDVATMPRALACHDHEEGFPRSFTEELEACEPGFTAPCPGHEKHYWLVMRGFDASDQAGGEGPYTIYIRDANAGTPVDVCAAGSNASEYTGTFEPGTYYAIVKGATANDAGWYQLTIGDPALAGTASYSDLKSYDATIRSGLQAAGVHVIGAQFGSDPALTSQLRTMALDTQTVSSTNQPLVVTLDPTDANLAASIGRGVVGAVQGLALAVRMNVGLRLDPAPSAANPGFTFSAVAVDSPNDGCEPPINQVHQQCQAGATPKFRVTFANPAAPNDVPPNPMDPNGGYSMTLVLEGDGKYELERIPVYLIPKDVTPETYTVTRATTGSYWQSFGSPSCGAAEQPDWSTLTWRATIPPSASLAWSVCTADTLEALDTCTLTTLATVTSGESCSSDADCLDGFCQAKVCQFAVGPACTADDTCGDHGVCVAGRCRFTGLPIDPNVALRTTAGNGKPFMRVQATLNASADGSAAPELYDWSVRYECVSSE